MTNTRVADTFDHLMHCKDIQKESYNFFPIVIYDAKQKQE